MSFCGFFSVTSDLVQYTIHSASMSSDFAVVGGGGLSKVCFPKTSGAYHALGTGKHPLGFTLEDAYSLAKSVV